MRIFLIILGATSGLAVLAALADAATAALFMSTVGKSLASYEPGMTWKLFNTYGLDPVYRSRLLKISVGFIFIMSLGLAMLVFLVRKKSNLHGDARFATAREVQQENLIGDKGILFGRMGKRYLMLPGQRHLFAVAPTRSGKTACIAIPNLLNWPDSVVALDVKNELFKKTSGFRAAHGHDVFLFSPFADDLCTNKWNPLDIVRRGDGRQSVHTVNDVLFIASILYPTKTGDATSVFFASQAQNLFLGITLFVLESKLPFNIPQLMRVRESPAEGGFPGFVQKVLNERTDLSERCRGCLQQFLSATGDTLSSILATFDAPLGSFRTALVEAATSSSDFKLTDLRRRRMTIYLGVSPREMEVGSIIMTLFVSQVLYANLDALPEQDPTIKHELLLLLDEFKVLGKMSILVDAAGYLAGYGIRLLTILQSLGQLDIYGQEAARSFATNHGAKVVYAPREEKDAKETSEALGYFTEMSESYSRSARGGKLLEQSSGLSTGVNVSAQKRALMLPQEVKLLPFKNELAFVEGVLPIRAEKAYFMDDEIFRTRLLPPISIAPLEIREDAFLPPATARPAPITAPAAQASSPASSPPQPAGIDAAVLDAHFDSLVMHSKDPEKPTEEEAARFVNEFMRGLEDLGAWRSA